MSSNCGPAVGEYKSHLGPDECCIDHCTFFALSDPETIIIHNLSCSDCQKIKNVLKDIEDKIESSEVNL